MVSFVELFLIAVVSLVTLFYLVGKHRQNGQKLPPGPKGLPILGSILSVGTKPHLTFGEWVKHYGNIFAVKILGIRVLVISDPKVAKDAFNNAALLGKPSEDLFKVFVGGEYGVLSTNGAEWHEQRRFTLRHLRDHGFGRSVAFDFVMDEVEEVLNRFKVESAKGESIDVSKKFGLAVVNSLWRIMSGKRFAQDDPKLTNLLDTGNKSVITLTSNPIGIFLPRVAAMFPKLTGWTKLVDAVNEIQSFFIEGLNESKKEFTHNKDEGPRDFIESYLNEIENTTDPNSTFYKDVGDKHLLGAVLDLFGAGSNTTSSTLSWNLLYLTLHPEIQEKLQKEIDTVVGKTRNVALSDRKDMPYTEAVILETLRKSSIAPLGLFHAALEDTTLGDYHIPKGTWICVNQYFIHHDPAIWGDPENFRPERWLSADGKTVVKNDALVAFSVGRRSCIGETLAKDSLFLFLTNLYQRFSISSCPNSPKPSMEAKSSFFLDVDPFKVVFKDRTVL